MKRFVSVLAAVLLFVSPASSWRNGGESEMNGQAKFGTHDYIALKGYELAGVANLPWITNNVNIYFLGTEAPDERLDRGRPRGELGLPSRVVERDLGAQLVPEDVLVGEEELELEEIAEPHRFVPELAHAVRDAVLRGTGLHPGGVG